MLICKKNWPVLAIAAALIILAIPAAADKLPNAKVAILDYQRLMRESKAAQQVRLDIEKLRKRYKIGFQKIENQLQSDRRELLQSKGSLKAEEYSKKRRNFERDMIKAQRRAQDQSRKLDRVFAAAMAKVQAAIVPIVKQYTNKLDVNLVVDSTQVFFAAKTLNITNSVISELNKKLKRVSVKVPAK